MNGEPIKEHPRFIGPKHEVGISADMEVREVEDRSHGDAPVPRQQPFANYT